MKLPSLLLWTVPCCSPNRTATGLLKKIMLIILEMACDVQIIKILTETDCICKILVIFLSNSFTWRQEKLTLKWLCGEYHLLHSAGLETLVYRGSMW